MKKNICDRCGAKCYKLKGIIIPDKRISKYYLSVKGIEVCPECKKEADRLFDIYVNTKLALFKDFLKGDSK